MPKHLWTVDNGCLRLNFHSGQSRAWQSEARFVCVLAGKQSGKTSWGPWWLWREIRTTARSGEQNDYLAVTASYDLFKLKMLPELRQCFEYTLKIARYWSGDRILELADLDPESPTYGQFLAKKANDPMWGRIILRSAEAPAGLESATAKAAWLDEAGHDNFTLETWDAVQGRVSLNVGRVLFTTTLYNLGWIKAQLYDKWQNGDPSIDVIQFDSTQNPSFSRAEFERLRNLLPLWKFNMQYRGRYERPAGLIYDSFLPEHKCPRFTLDPAWPRFLGLDFGGVNTVALFYAEEPGTKRLYLYREYKAGERSAQEHVDAILKGEPMIPFCVGGSKSEGQWRREFRKAGLPVHAPDIKEVDVGILRVYGAHRLGQIIVFEDLDGYLNEKANYSRKLDSDGEPTEEIADKSTYHHMDAERYIIGRIRRI